MVTLDKALEAVHLSMAIDSAWRTFELLKGAASVLKIRSTLHTHGDSWTTILSLSAASSCARSPGEMLRNSAWICPPCSAVTTAADLMNTARKPSRYGLP